MREREPQPEEDIGFEDLVEELNLGRMFEGAESLGVTEKDFEGAIMHKRKEMGGNSPDHESVGGSASGYAEATIRWGLANRLVGVKPSWTLTLTEKYDDYDASRSVTLDLLKGEISGEQQTVNTVDGNSTSSIKSEEQKIALARRVSDILKN